MLTHSIRVYHEAPAMALRDISAEERPRLVAGSQAHRDYIRNITVNRAKQIWQLDVYVQLKNGNSDEVGIITNVFTNEEEGVRWSGMKCRPVQVYWYDRRIEEVYHPEEIIPYVWSDG